MSDSPSLLSAGVAILRALRVGRPRPVGTEQVAHDALARVLDTLSTGGIPGLDRRHIAVYRNSLETVDPSQLSRDEALAFWLNLYNAGALDLAAAAFAEGHPSVLRLPGVFDEPWAEIAGESLSLNDIEHGKIRRFGDPRIHSALVCGSVSCPTLRYEPYVGTDLDNQLDDQMKQFLRSGGARREGGRALLSRVFLWYGSDFVRPHRMPSFLPVSKRAVLVALEPWLERDLVGLPVSYQSYDWGLACTIG